MGFPFYRQLDQMDCGPACLRMIAAHYGQHYSLPYLRERAYLDREGVSLRGIAEAAEQIGMNTVAAKLPLEGRGPDEPGLRQAPLPCILHWGQRHFVVLYKLGRRHAWIADPAIGRRKISLAELEREWLSDGDMGIALLLEPLPAFYEQEGEPPRRQGLYSLYQYLRPHWPLLRQLILGLLLASIFQLLFPFLAQAIVDIGIQNQDIGFIYLVLLAQLALFAGQLTVNILQGWILLHVGTRVNVALLSDFLIKLMRLPIGFFEAKMTGDLLQRIGDQRRIESFLTNSSLSILLSAFSLLAFGLVLLLYSAAIFGVFLLFGFLYIGWILLFMRRRELVDNLRFQHLSENQSTLIELIQGMQEIKLQRSERKRRWQWANVQARLFRANVRSLTISQYQDTGASFFNQLKDIIITFMAAYAVIQGEMTLGMLLAVQYIVGQLNGPLQQMAAFLRAAQDARISLERLTEVQEAEEEQLQGPSLIELPPGSPSLRLKEVSFRYNPLSDFALEGLSLEIPRGQVTAIVGASGSGKTTLVKLLLGFYRPTSGSILAGDFNLQQLAPYDWRGRCGAVMQDGFIFSDTIAHNIAESASQVDSARLARAARTANIHEFIESLPLGYNTMVGARGNGLSQGQRQRLLIARAVYKSPDLLFFDEATNALDATNEKTILENLATFFEGRTVIVVAHRLSTVRSAGQIVVLDKGRLVESGTHDALVEKRGAYYQLIKNQLELGG